MTRPERAIVNTWRAADRVDTATASTALPIVQRVESIARAIEAALGRAIDVESWGPTVSGKRTPRLPAR